MPQTSSNGTAGATIIAPVSPAPRKHRPTGNIVPVPFYNRGEVWFLTLLVVGAILLAGHMAGSKGADSKPIKVNVAAPSKGADFTDDSASGAGITVKGKGNRVRVVNAAQDNSGLTIDGDNNNVVLTNGNGTVRVTGKPVRSVTVSVNE